ncbi:hypothetical protein [Actinophytocola glycyrrhizae]|uniref:DUF11 domain-containing protein n=1 Tax=Actinophytocola glycyrrhizae TaxID=2044873 RepID=A0ABV9S1U0_9PSEU
MRAGLVGALVVLAGLVLPGSAVAAPPEPSAAILGAAEVVPGGTFTVSVELFNPHGFGIESAAAQLRLAEAPITAVVELVSCDGGACYEYSPTSYRGGVGDLAPGGEATVVFTFRVLESAALGDYPLEHQLVGANYSFAPGHGPVVSVVPSPQVADLAVSLDASPRGILTSRVTYTVSVANHGPANASPVRVGGTYAAGLAWAGGSGCVRDGGRSVVCDFSSVPVGGTGSASFSVNAGLLTLGSFSASVARVSSTPSDPDGGNDSARRSCTALTGLLVRC